MNWTEAQTYCRKNYTDLVTLHSEGDAQRAKKPGGPTWIGLRRSPMKWSNGDVVKYKKIGNSSNEGWKHCYAMKTFDQWEEVSCTQNRSFMCYTKGDSGRSLKYTLIQEKRSWCEAQSYCREHHTDLVSISTREQNEDVKTNGSSTPFWIDLMHTDWEWSDGACSTFRNWKKEPEEGSDCGYIIEGEMGAQGCHMTAEAMCYKEEIHLIQENKTWERALDFCNNHYKGLLRIESYHDQRALEGELKNSTAPGPVWLGLRQSRLFGFWFWPNGLSVAWSNWEGRSQPEQPLSHICGAIATSGPGKFKWSDQNCLSESYFLCEGRQR
ncbi:hypothetical protein SKAU_G00040260 [Synaphobranchus kaupii]|uniref:C-type lectin domain-containing protein n=1 Tax=Synaphobranchus kaupii TaxID=118154 RepID=A0A9Q1G1T1_SYNKA|nr:hypothetical protein SKAU_G00040260 [Synaphobranchus kaupii]